jgi:hypothetical protein
VKRLREGGTEVEGVKPTNLRAESKSNLNICQLCVQSVWIVPLRYWGARFIAPIADTVWRLIVGDDTIRAEMMRDIHH